MKYSFGQFAKADKKQPRKLKNGTAGLVIETLFIVSRIQAGDNRKRCRRAFDKFMAYPEEYTVTDRSQLFYRRYKTAEKVANKLREGNIALEVRQGEDEKGA